MPGHGYTMDRPAAAKYLGVSCSTLDHLSSRRAVAFVRLGRRSYYAEADLLHFVESRRVGPAGERTK